MFYKSQKNVEQENVHVCSKHFSAATFLSCDLVGLFIFVSRVLFSIFRSPNYLCDAHHFPCCYINWNTNKLQIDKSTFIPITWVIYVSINTFYHAQFMLLLHTVVVKSILSTAWKKQIFSPCMIAHTQVFHLSANWKPKFSMVTPEWP